MAVLVADLSCQHCKMGRCEGHEGGTLPKSFREWEKVASGAGLSVAESTHDWDMAIFNRQVPVRGCVRVRLIGSEDYGAIDLTGALSGEPWRSLNEFQAFAMLAVLAR